MQLRLTLNSHQSSCLSLQGARIDIVCHCTRLRDTVLRAETYNEDKECSCPERRLVGLYPADSSVSSCAHCYLGIASVLRREGSTLLQDLVLTLSMFFTYWLLFPLSF